MIIHANIGYCIWDRCWLTTQDDAYCECKLPTILLCYYTYVRYIYIIYNHKCPSHCTVCSLRCLFTNDIANAAKTSRLNTVFTHYLGVNHVAWMIIIVLVHFLRRYGHNCGTSVDYSVHTTECSRQTTQKRNGVHVPRRIFDRAHAKTDFMNNSWNNELSVYTCKYSRYFYFINDVYILLRIWK